MMRRSDSSMNSKVNPLAPMESSVALRLHVRSDLHLMRKAWHLVMGMMIAMIYWNGMDRWTACAILGAFLVWDLGMEALRLRNQAFNERILRFWGPIMRSSEVNRMSAVPHYLIASIIAIAIFPKPVALLSIAYLACGDPIASLFGIRYGDLGPRMKNGKSLIGTSAGVLTCALVTFGFLKMLNFDDAKIVLLSVIGGIAGGTAELLPIDMDDNFTIPVVSGFVMWLAFMALN
jgi:dolichol kinase